MKYKLIEGSDNNYENLQEMKINILKNRDVINLDYLKLDSDKVGSKYENDYNKLDNINEAVKCLLKHVENDGRIFTVADCDVDGVCSFAELYMYLKSTFPNLKIKYSIHTGKQHGLSSDIEVPNGTTLVIMTDSSSEDFEQHRKLKEQGIDVVVLDHHEAEKVSENAIVVNNQLCDYPNKQLCGSAIVYKFLQALDDELWQSKADEYIDLVALGLIGDNMNVSEMETKYYIEKGLKHIRNKQFKALIEKQDYSMKGLVNMNNVAFYIAPLINAMIRIGKQDEKKLLYQGFIQDYEEFDYKPRGNKPIEKEDIYKRVARLCGNTKSRQDKMRDKQLKDIDEIILTQNKNNDKIIIVDCEHKYHLGLTGVVAIKLADKYNKPCLLVNKSTDGLLRGSGRNTDRNEIKDLKDLLNKTGIAEGKGHKQAFGVSFKSEELNKLINILNDKLKDVDFSANTYDVDYIIPFEDLQDEIVFEINLLKNLWGKGFDEPLIAIEDIEIEDKEIQVIGKSNNTLKFSIDGLDLIKFNVDSNDKLIQNTSDWESDENKTFKLNIVGKCSINDYNGVKTPQIIVQDYEII